MTDTTDLLTAVDALTEPQPRKVIMDDSHDHDWLAVKIIRTAKEVKALKKAGDKTAEKEVFSGDWWCPWCDTTTRTIDRTPPTTSVLRGNEKALLDQLEEAVATSSEAAGGSQRPAERTPVAVGALDLSVEIRREVNRWMLRLGGVARGNVTLSQLVRSWYTLTLTGRTSGFETLKLRTWASSIMGMLYPVEHPEIMEICPRCEFAYVLLHDARKRALQGTNADTYDKTRVECLVCGAEWTGWDQLHELKNATRRMDGREKLESVPLIG